jgi:predicted nucleic acid-binding protein
MTVFFDTNVPLDIIARRMPFMDDSRAAVSMSGIGDVTGVATDMTFCTIAYIMRKSLRGEQLRSVLKTLHKYISVVPVTNNAMTEAIDNFVGDFEDEVQYRAALAAGADVIITRNKDDFANSAIPVMTPTEFLDKMDNGGLRN